MDSSRVPLKGGGDHAVRGRQHGTPSAAPLSRRKLGLGLLLGFSGVAAIPSEARDLTPYERGFRLEYGLTADGRMRSCPSDSNPNCVSSASLNEVGSQARAAAAPAKVICQLGGGDKPSRLAVPLLQG